MENKRMIPCVCGEFRSKHKIVDGDYPCPNGSGFFYADKCCAIDVMAPLLIEAQTIIKELLLNKIDRNYTTMKAEEFLEKLDQQ